MRSPRRSPAERSSSEDGSQYEMDLDALGLNSTFESTALEKNYEPFVDHVDTSEVEGPDDFTMNMTYWMTSDLPPAQVKSRKETKASRPVPSKGDQVGDGGNHAAAEVSTTASPTASPTVRLNGTTASREYSTVASERSMENEEKVRSFLSALPDTELDNHPNGTPLRAPQQSLLQVPRSSPPKARSLQATVEDETPRKPTHQTVIHHPSPTAHSEHRSSEDPVVILQSRLDQQELASRTRITELETILSYTRTELDGARNDSYRHKDSIARLERSLEEQRAKQDALTSSIENRLKEQGDAHNMKLQHLEEELRRDNLLKLQKQREDFEHQMKELEGSKRAVGEDAENKSQELKNAQTELIQLRQANAQDVQRVKDMQTEQEQKIKQDFAAERTEMENTLASVQAQANALRADLSRATAEAKAVREESQTRQADDAAARETSEYYLTRIAHLETNLRDAKFSLECAQADVAAKAQLFNTNLDLNASLRALRSDLETQRSAFTDLSARKGSRSILDAQLQSELTVKDQLIAQHVAEKDGLERQLSTAQGRISGLEASIAALRAQLADAHRESGSARAEVERVSQDLEDAIDRLADVRAEADRRVADVEKKHARMKDLKNEVESKFRELQSQHDDLVAGHAAMMEDVRDKAEDAVRKTGALLAQERKDRARLKKSVEQMQKEIDQLRAESMQKTDEESEPESDDTTTPLPTAVQVNEAKDREIESLRTIIKNQVAELKALKSSHNSTLASLKATHEATLGSLRAEQSALQSRLAHQSRDHEATLNTLRAENTALQSRLTTQSRDHEAINAAMDQQLSQLLTKLMKERARTVVGKRDGQWEENMDKVQREKEVLGKVLMRQWGREEVGIADEKKGQKQLYEYQYVKRER